MKKNNLDAFKAKANTVLLTDALLNVTGGQQDPEYCHVNPPFEHGKGKTAAGYSQFQVDRFFSNPQWTLRFDEMYDPTNPNSPNQRDAYFKSIVSQF